MFVITRRVKMFSSPKTITQFWTINRLWDSDIAEAKLYKQKNNANCSVKNIQASGRPDEQDLEVVNLELAKSSI